MTVGAEIVGRYPGDMDGFAAAWIELKYCLIAPDIDTVQGDINRQIANEPDAEFPRMPVYPPPLTEEQVLFKNMIPNLVSKLYRRLIQGL